MTEFVALCYICSGTAKHSCSSCGKRVCKTHYDAKSGFCTACKSGKQFHQAR